MDDIAQPADPTPRRSYPTVREATDFATTAYLFDGKGNVQQTDFEHGPVNGPDKGFILVAGSLSSPQFKHWLQEHLDGAAAEGLTATDQHARCTVIDDKALVVLRILRSRTDPEELSKQTMSIWLEKNRVIIASKLAINELINIPHWQKSKHAPLSPADLIARMGTRAADRIEPLVEHLGDALDTIEDEMMSNHDEHSRDKLTRLRRSLISVRRLLWPQRDVLNT